MKCRKTVRPSGIVAKMLKASGSVGLEVLAHLMKSVIAEGVVPADWRDSIIVNLYKGKGNALDRGNYRGLKLTDHVMKLVQHVLERRIRKMVDIDEMQFGLVSGRSATDAVFIVRQLREKYLAVKKPLFFVFVDLEKAFDRVPRKVIWWEMRKLGVEEWAQTVAVLQRLQRNDRSMIRWICGVKPKDRSPSSVFLRKLKIPDIRTPLQSRRLRWYSHVRRSYPLKRAEWRVY